MRFSKISITKPGVHLVRQTRSGNDVEESDFNSSDKPKSSFVDSLQALKPYVTKLLGDAIVVDPEKMTVTTLNLSQDKNGLRGLIVTATVPVANAYNKPLVLNTPLVREGGENASAEAFVLEDEVLELINLAEQEATQYLQGDRVQLELMAQAEAPSENTKEVNERMAHAEVTSTRKPKAKRAPRNAADAEAASATWNPDKTVAMTTAVLRQLLLTVERDVPEDAITQWTSSERDAAQRWGEARQKEIIGQLADDRVPSEPACVIKASSPSLAEGWSDSKPPRPDAAGIESIKSEVNRNQLHVQ